MSGFSKLTTSAIAQTKPIGRGVNALLSFSITGATRGKD